MEILSAGYTGTIKSVALLLAQLDRNKKEHQLQTEMSAMCHVR